MRNGDIILTGRKHQGIASSTIRLGSKIRYGFNSPYAVWPHCAIVYDAALGISCEAGKGGVHLGNIQERFGDDYFLIPTNVTTMDWVQVKRFLDSCLTAKWKYGVPTFIGLGVYCVTSLIPFFPTICFQQAGSAICSGLVCEALTRAGYIWELPPYWMMPADLAAHFDVRP